MFDRMDGARHLPFFGALAELDEGDPRWRSVSAGLVVLRLVDAWIVEGASAVAGDDWGMRSVYAAIEEMPTETPARAVLRSIVDAVKESPTSDMHAVAPRLMAYARSLDLDAKWELAADVYETVIAHVHPLDESDVAIAAHLRLAFNLRELGHLDRSADVCDDAAMLARTTGDMVGVLRAQIGRARIAVTRGNLPDAERHLDEAISRAWGDGLAEVRTVALQERANVAHLRGHYDSAIRLAYEALGHTSDPINRDRLLLDIAGSFYMLGARSVARDAYMILEATAQEQYQRWVAAINIMELAAAEGATVVFEHHRRNLLGQPLGPVLQTQLHIHIGSGYADLGQPLAARAALKTAHVLAERYQLNQLLFAAEERLSRIDERRSPLVPEPILQTPELCQIAAALRARGRELTAR